MIEAAIFDFDGTLTPLTLDFSILRTRTEEIAREYVDPSAVSLPGEYIIEMIYRISDMLPEGAPFRERAFHELCRMEVEACREKTPYSYTRDVLAGLRSKGVRVGIITRTCMDVIRSVFPDHGDYVDAIVTRDDTRHVKPDPEHVRMALERLGTSAHRALMVGDHPTDIEAGRASGTVTAGVLTGRTAKDLFVEARADHILDDIRGVVGLIDAGRRA